MASDDIFSYLNDLYDLLPDQDRRRFGELWKSYEQTYGAVWTEILERELASNINNVPLYNTKRWLKHTFDGTTQVNRAAHYRTNQDLSRGINLTVRYLVRFSIDGGPQIEVDLRGTIPTVTTNTEIVSKINTAAGFTFATLVVLGALIDLKSSTAGPTSQITFHPASSPTHDAAALIFGLDPLTLPLSVPRFPYSFQLLDPFIVSVPLLQNKIRDESVTSTLQEGTHYSVEFGSGVISFMTLPFPLSVPSAILLTGNTIVTIADTTPVLQGMSVSGPGILAGTTVQSVSSRTQFVLNQAPTASGTVTLNLAGGFMWAKNTLINLETPYNNFGYLLDLYDVNTPSYLKAVKGLWFAFWTGPRPENIRRSLYLLFGLPAASQNGTVTALTLTTVTLTYTDGSTEVFTIPLDLAPLVVVGEAVTRFQPLVSGITVLDKVNSPGFLAREVGRFGIQTFLTEKATLGDGPNTDETRALKTIEENTYLPQIDVNAFISPDIKLSNVKTFLRNIQPKSRTFLFQVLVGNFRELLDIEEVLGQSISFDVTPNLDYNPSLEIQESDRDDTETNPLTGNILDSEGFTLTGFLDIDVVHQAHTLPVLVDSFHVEG